MAQRQTINLSSMAPDLISEDAPADVWNIATNVVFRNGETVAAGADEVVMPSASIIPKVLIYVEPFDQGFWVYADETGVFVNDGTNEFDITPTSWDNHGAAPVFTGAVTNGLATINSSNRAPCYWDGNTGNICIPLPDWPVGGTCNALRGHKNFLMAVGMTSEGGQRVRWSTAAEAGTIPDSWTPLSSNQAGFIDFAPLSSSCLDGLSMRDDFMVYKRETTWRMVYVGGNDIFAVQKVFAEQGIAATNGVARGPQDQHMLVTSSGDIALTDGVTFESILSGRAQRSFYDDFQNAVGSVFSLFTLNREKLGGVIYPAGTATEGNRILMFDYDSGDISFREANNIICASEGRFLQDVGAQNEWDDDSKAWNTDATAWNQQVTAATVEDVLFGSDLNGIELFASSPIALPVNLEKRGVAFGNPQLRKQVSRIWPKFVGTSIDLITFRVGGQELAGGPITLSAPYEYQIGQGVPIDLFMQGRFMALILESTGTGVWRLGSVDIEYTEVGGW